MKLQFVLVRPACGLGNRFRALACTYALCKYQKCPMHIYWTSNDDCTINWNEIVVPSFPISTHTFASVFDEYPDCSPYFQANEHTELFLKQQPRGFDALVIEGGHDFKHPNMPVADLLSLKHEFYELLLTYMQPSILLKAREFVEKINLEKENTIAVHVRGYVPKYDEADMRKDPSWENFENNTIVQSTILFMKHQRNNPTFVLVSNSEALRDAICHAMKDSSCNIVTYEDDLVDISARDASCSVLHSLVEMVIMSQCSHIIGSYKSSFSDEAAFMGNITKVCSSLREKGNAYHCYGFSTSSEGVQCINVRE